MSKFKSILVFCVFALLPLHAFAAPDAEAAMNNAQLGKIIKRLDKEASGRSGYWQLHIDGVPLTVITDEKANRMRIIAPVADANKLDKKMLRRVMQANFDTALDTRYSIAKDVLWAAFIHPLRSLSPMEFVSGMAQTTNLVKSFGKDYASGALTFGGGDSSKLLRERHQQLLEKGLSI